MKRKPKPKPWWYLSDPDELAQEFKWLMPLHRHAYDDYGQIELFVGEARLIIKALLAYENKTGRSKAARSTKTKNKLKA